MNAQQEVVSPNARSLPAQLESLPIFKCYAESPYLSKKHSTYFQVYADLFERFRGKSFTFVEVGVLNGGSLFMWRKYFGENARIIGVDLNPGAARWRKDGFEIFIGSQSDPAFWSNFFQEVGDVDVILDDGGHTYEQQIVTAHCCIPHIKDGGQLVVEDTHTSYFEDFGYPSKYTFIAWVKSVVDNINSRFPSIRTSDQSYKNEVYSVRTFESIVCFEIDRSKCFMSQPVNNEGRDLDARDFRGVDAKTDSLDGFKSRLTHAFGFAKHIPFARGLARRSFAALHRMVYRKNAQKVRGYF